MYNLSVFLAKSASHPSVASVTSHSADKGSEEFNESSSSSELLVSYDVLLESGCKIHKDTLKSIWQKASSLVADTTLIAAVLGGGGGANSGYDRMVASTSSNCPYLVSTPAKFTGQLKCDSKCPVFSTYKLCAHSIASAEVNGQLKEFTQWLIRQKCAPNYSKLALHGIPKGAGEKSGVPKNTRKRKQVMTNKTVVDRLSLDNSKSPHCSIQEQHIYGWWIMFYASRHYRICEEYLDIPTSVIYLSHAYIWIYAAKHDVWCCTSSSNSIAKSMAVIQFFTKLMESIIIPCDFSIPFYIKDTDYLYSNLSIMSNTFSFY